MVSRIKEDPLQCRLLVLDDEGDAWYKERNIPVTMEMPNIIYCSSGGVADEEPPEYPDDPPRPPLEPEIRHETAYPFTNGVRET